jgi:hypothetical protein
MRLVDMNLLILSIYEMCLNSCNTVLHQGMCSFGGCRISISFYENVWRHYFIYVVNIWTYTYTHTHTIIIQDMHLFIQELFWITAHITLHSGCFAWWQGGQRSPLFHFAVSRGPCVVVEWIVVNINFTPINRKAVLRMVCCVSLYYLTEKRHIFCHNGTYRQEWCRNICWIPMWIHGLRKRMDLIFLTALETHHTRALIPCNGWHMVE